MAEFTIFKSRNAKLYLYTTPTSVLSVMPLVKHICQTSLGKIYVVGGCHGDVSGQNWTSVDEKLVYDKRLVDARISVFYREDIAELRKPYPRRTIKYVDLGGGITADELLELFDDGGHFVLGYCYSNRDAVIEVFKSGES